MMPLETHSTREQIFAATAELFGLLSSPCRVGILYELCKSERNVGELLGLLGGTQPNISHHLNALYRAGVLQRRREGARMFYQLLPDRVDFLCEALKRQQVMACWKQGGHGEA